MDFLIHTFYGITALFDLNIVATLLRSAPFTYIIVIALFCCILLIIATFSRYRIFSFKMVIAWILSCCITLFYLASANNVELEIMQDTINSQVILSFASSILLFIFYILSMLSAKPKRKKKNYGYNGWWICIISFIVLLAFCCVFNVGLFVASALFYL